MKNNLDNLNISIINCKKCKRLVTFRQKVANEKRKQYLSENYWGKPITGFGDINAKILIVGLAPAAHGANRTGRVFTGDKSSDFLYKCLYKADISNKEKSEHKDDNLILKNAYITLALKCLPPKDKPTSNELKNCFNFFKNEIKLLENLKVIIALGRIAFDSCVNLFKLDKKKVLFKHGYSYQIDGNLKLKACYHPSPRNVNSKIINESKMTKIFLETKKEL